jgi:hypothetical protein
VTLDEFAQFNSISWPPKNDIRLHFTCAISGFIWFQLVSTGLIRRLILVLGNKKADFNVRQYDTPKAMAL